MLIVEISDTTLRHERGEKGGLDARAGLADYWIVNPASYVLAVYRDPAADAGAPRGWRKASVVTLRAGDVVTPLAAPPLPDPGPYLNRSAAVPR